MIFGGFLDTDLTNQCYIIDHNTKMIEKMRKKQRPNQRGADAKIYTENINRNAAANIVLDEQLALELANNSDD